MIEPLLRPTYQKWFITPLLPKLPPELTPNGVTLGSAVLGILVLPALCFNHIWLGVGLLMASGYLDCLDGSLARHRNQSTPTGTLLDITFDRVVEVVVMIGLFTRTPGTPFYAYLTLTMMGSVLLCITTFLVVGIFSDNHSERSFHYSPGLIERPEAFGFFIGMMVLPNYYTLLSVSFTALVLFTAVIRICEFYKLFQTQP